METTNRMHVGDWVEVRSEAEILQTLDSQGRVEGLPFMPEMFHFCGQRFQVYKSAHKTCDGISRQSRRMERTVHLDTRCSGDAHGGCQSGCLLFWKEVWLRPLHSPEHTALDPGQDRHAKHNPSPPTKQEVGAYGVVQENDSVRYRCQITQIRDASTPLLGWDVRQYIQDIRSGNVDAWTVVSRTAASLELAMSRTGFGVGRMVRWINRHFPFLFRGASFSHSAGRVPKGGRTPVAELDLCPGELVHVRSLKEIGDTLDPTGKNRGLYFDPEQIPYVNRTFRVDHRLERIISEETGRMLEFTTATVVLESVVCEGRYSTCRMFCPKGAYLFWREVWLERPRETSSPAEVKQE